VPSTVKVPLVIVTAGAVVYPNPACVIDILSTSYSTTAIATAFDEIKSTSTDAGVIVIEGLALKLSPESLILIVPIGASILACAAAEVPPRALFLLIVIVGIKKYPPNPGFNTVILLI